MSVAVAHELSRIDFVSGEETHIYLFSLRRLADEESEKESIALMGSAELEALARIKAPHRRMEFLYGRATLRRLLAIYGGTAAEGIMINHDSGGKPCAKTFNEHWIPVFNVSHSGDVLAIAVSPHGQVGIDVEQADRKLGNDLENIAKRHFSLEEWRTLEATPSESRLDVFFRMWTLKEAILKAVGVGLFHPLANINVAGVKRRYSISVCFKGKEGLVEAEYLQVVATGVHIAVARLDSLKTLRVFDKIRGA